MVKNKDEIEKFEQQSEDNFDAFKKDMIEKQSAYEKKATKDISKGFILNNVISVLIGILILFVGFFCYKGYEKGTEASEKIATLTVRFDEHERQQRIWENSIIKKDQYCLSTKLLFLNIQDIKAILAGKKTESLKIEEEIRQLEGKLLIQEIDDVTRGAK